MTESTEVQTQEKRPRPIIANVLADRYASIPTLNVFAPMGRAVVERGLWLAVMKAQAEQGLDIPSAAIEAYERTLNTIDLDWIRQREIEIRHDEKAKIEAYNRDAGYEYSHIGLTSRDHSDNVDLILNRAGLMVIRDHSVATAARMAEHAVEYSGIVYADRTHLAPAQPSLVGKNFSNFGEEFLMGFGNVEQMIDRYPFRGLKGAIGTQTDQLQLFDGDAEKVDMIEQRLLEFSGFNRLMNSVGQIYPRSLDFQLVSHLYQLVCGVANLANTSRMMAGLDEFTEGFKEGQVGSSAMPHKKNMRTSERIKSLKAVLAGHVTMASMISGEQLYSGDVSDSAARRVFLPDAFFATDGVLEASLTVMQECGVYPAVIQNELNRYLPFLTTTRLLMLSVQNGIGRETAHEVIKKHSVDVANNRNATGSMENDLLDRLAQDSRLGLTKVQMGEAISKPVDFVGNAGRQIKRFAETVSIVVAKYPEAASYEPEEIL